MKCKKIRNKYSKCYVIRKQQGRKKIQPLLFLGSMDFLSWLDRVNPIESEVSAIFIKQFMFFSGIMPEDSVTEDFHFHFRNPHIIVSFRGVGAIAPFIVTIYIITFLRYYVKLTAYRINFLQQLNYL